jgi:hypothetical protein
MWTSFGFEYSRSRQAAPQSWDLPHRVGPAHDHEDDDADKGAVPGADASAREDLPYKVELWDVAKAGVEQVLAVTASASIGFAAFYGAAREFPDRYITLRHKGSIIARWNEPRH